jgi:hypothetical protein
VARNGALQHGMLTIGRLLEAGRHSTAYDH